MKTAMQEAIEHFKNINYDLVNVPIQNVPHILEQFLEKEKEQMLDFGLYVKKNGWVGCKIEDLYEDYNNQNK
jgi:hypothetical protein